MLILLQDPKIKFLDYQDLIEPNYQNLIEEDDQANN
jgi:hypothetical protein